MTVPGGDGDVVAYPELSVQLDGLFGLLDPPRRQGGNFNYSRDYIAVGPPRYTGSGTYERTV